MFKRFLFFFLTGILSYGILFSQGTPNTVWKTSLTPFSGSQAILSVPFVYPMEADLFPTPAAPSLPSQSDSTLIPGLQFSWVNSPTILLNSFSRPQVSVLDSIAPLSTLNSSENLLSISGWWNANTPQSFQRTNQGSVVYLHKEMKFSLDGTLRREWTGGLTTEEMSQMRLAFSYRVGANWNRFFQDNRLEIFLHLAEVQRSANQVLAAGYSPQRRDLAQKTNLFSKQIYANPGFSLGTNFLVFEGMIRVPMNAREANATLDTLWAPEVQGNLGMKYIFP